jgi:F0F1-type ATP synthase assembly protein I
MHGFLANTNPIVCAFLLILGLIAAAATILDRTALQPIRISEKSSDSNDDASPAPES